METIRNYILNPVVKAANNPKVIFAAAGAAFGYSVRIINFQITGTHFLSASSALLSAGGSIALGAVCGAAMPALISIFDRAIFANENNEGQD